jgi:hydroxymethylbilane synthase
MSTPEAPSLEQPLRIGTRKSKLALWQAHFIKGALEQRWGADLKVELVEMVTEGDRILDRPLNEVGGKGLFTKGIEQKLIDGGVELAVHSMKDLPGNLPEGLELTCTPERADPRDAIVTGLSQALAKMPPGTRLGTSSLRRGALARRMNPGLQIISIRGNVPTRIKKADDGEVDAVLLAAAGLDRLGLSDRISERLDVERFCPAACQGILALEAREGDARVAALVAPLDHPETAIAAAAERAYLTRLEGGCQVPMGCYARLSGPELLSVRGVVADPTGRPILAATEAGHPSQAAQLGNSVAETLLRLGADRIIANLTTGPA